MLPVPEASTQELDGTSFPTHRIDDTAPFEAVEIITEIYGFVLFPSMSIPVLFDV